MAFEPLFYGHRAGILQRSDCWSSQSANRSIPYGVGDGVFADVRTRHICVAREHAYPWLMTVDVQPIPDTAHGVAGQEAKRAAADAVVGKAHQERVAQACALIGQDALDSLNSKVNKGRKYLAVAACLPALIEFTFACVLPLPMRFTPRPTLRQGYYIKDGFLGEEAAAIMREEAVALFRCGDMQKGESTRWNPDTEEVETYEKDNVLTMQVQGGSRWVVSGGW